MLLVFSSVAGLSFVLIFFHDALVQSSCFQARSVTVEGCRRISPSEILQWGNLDKTTNILSLNIKALQHRLTSHPWIKSADIWREVPDKIHIRVSEYTPVAIVDCGQKFLLDDKGTIFKKLDHGEEVLVPIVSGLKMSDLRMHRGRRPSLLEGVLAVTQLSRLDGSILPLHSITAIQVDSEMGLTLYAFDSDTAIKLGFGNYQAKFNRFRDMIPYLKKQQGLLQVRCVDLKDTGRVIVKTEEDDSKEV
jgi:cell division protein FtsQ